MGQKFTTDTVNQTLLFPPSLQDWLREGHLPSLSLQTTLMKIQMPGGESRQPAPATNGAIETLNQLMKKTITRTDSTVVIVGFCLFSCPSGIARPLSITHQCLTPHS
jgi:hypothetical protein